MTTKSLIPESQMTLQRVFDEAENMRTDTKTANTKLYLSMEGPKRAGEEGLVEYAERLSELYMRTYTSAVRKSKGQFFTPGQVSRFMANLFDISHSEIRLLDPGAGTGILTAAFCERLLDRGKTVNLTIDAYENDPNLVPLLRMVLELCKVELERRGHNVEYNIDGRDFILHNEIYFREPDLLLRNEERVLYDFVISNPPYYKINKNSPQSIAMMELVSGQPNIYALFMALSASMVKPDGEMVFITPRSFCSGLYYEKFREWFLDAVQILNVHIFESRKEVFDKDEILQENIIIKGKKLKGADDHEKLEISISENKDFDKLRKIEVGSDDVVCRKNKQVFVRIPTTAISVDILHTVDKWSYTLSDLGLDISTGPVVPFRAEQYLVQNSAKEPQAVPLLWMHNMQGMKVVWPAKKNNKALAILSCSRTKPLLLQTKNYVLVKRFSSKEQKRRLYAAVLLESEFPYNTLGIENHVNYIHRPNGNLSVYEAFGIAVILNTAFIDNFFRSLNGNTQVNATEIRSLPFPNIEAIRKIGKLVYESKSYQDGFYLDSIVAEVLGINFEIIKGLNKD